MGTYVSPLASDILQCCGTFYFQGFFFFLLIVHFSGEEMCSYVQPSKIRS